MSGLIRIISRVGFGLVVTMTVAFSASCGCGGGSAGPPDPASGNGGYNGGYTDYTGHDNNYHDYYGNHNYYNDYTRDDYYRPQNYTYGHDSSSKYTSVPSHDRHRDTRRTSFVNRCVTNLLRERWLAGAGYLVDAEYHNVQKASATGLSDWLSLLYKPVCDPASPPDAEGVASAMYSLTSDSLGDSEVYLELTWEEAPGLDGGCWVAVYRPGFAENTWNWFRPDAEMRIALHPLAQYRCPTVEQRVYVAVVVTGRRPSILRQIALREYHVQDGTGADAEKSKLPAPAAGTYSLVLQPACAPDSLPGGNGVATALYTLETAGMDEPEMFLDLAWGVAPLSAEYCRVAIARPGLGEDSWNWFQPGPDMRIGLTPASLYQDPADNDRITVKVEVLGYEDCTLRGVVLHRYSYDW